MSPFKDFNETLGPAIKCEGIPKSVVEQYSNILPPMLIEHWTESGWCAYAEGLLWVVNPNDFKHIPEDWLDSSSQEAVVFARTAFADLFIWVHNKVYFLSVHHGWTKELTDDIEILFEVTFCREKYIKKGLLGEIFQRVLPRIGVPEADECLAFVPALALGGSETANNVQKVKIHEHLAMLAQLHQS